MRLYCSHILDYSGVFEGVFLRAFSKSTGSNPEIGGATAVKLLQIIKFNTLCNTILVVLLEYNVQLAPHLHQKRLDRSKLSLMF